MDNIVLADGKSTPANHTFVPVSNVNGLYVYEEKNVDAAVGNYRITMSLKSPAKTTTAYKAVIKMWIPQLEVTAGSTETGYQAAPKVAFRCISESHFELPERSGLAIRKDSSALFANLLDHATVKSLLNDLVTPI